MSMLTLVFGIIQIVAGVVLVGLYSADYHDTITDSTLEKPDTVKAKFFGPIIVGLLVVVNGAIGIIGVKSKSTNLDILYMLGAAVSATACAALVYQYALEVADCNKTLGSLSPNCTDKQSDIRITLLAFNTIACVIGVLGMVVTALQQCRR